MGVRGLRSQQFCYLFRSLGSRWLGVLTLGIVVLTALVATPTAARADDDDYPYTGSIPDRTGVEYNQLFTDSLKTLPGLREVSSKQLYVFGSSRDDLIYDVQFSRGYQLRPEADPGRLVGSGTLTMQPEMAKAWAALRAGAARQGWRLSVASAFRSVDVQRSIARSRYGHADTWSEVDAVARWISVPGTSKHHSGYTIDIGFAGRKLQSYDSAYSWLAADDYAVAKSYGFIPSYPPDGGKQGPNPEPWEWNWIGIDSLLCGSGAETSTDGTFCDDDGSVFESSIEWLASEGITEGCNPPDNDRFCPNDHVTRGQLAAFLVRAFDYSDKGQGDLFVDDNDSVFEAAIDKLGTAEVTRGCNPPANDRFCPNRHVTRGELAAFLVRAIGYAVTDGGDQFVDDNGSPFENAINRLGSAGLTKGCNPPANDRYCPNDYVTRGQLAAFLRRALG
jgi:hypothetical protein